MVRKVKDGKMRVNIHFFDLKSEDDLRRLRAIDRSDESRRWMEGSGKMSDEELKDWAKARGQKNSCLFAVSGRKGYVEEDEVGRVQGFVYFYFFKKQKQLAEEAVRLGILTEPVLKGRIFEVSFAKYPGSKKRQMAEALRLSCGEIKKIYKKRSSNGILFIAFVDPRNKPSWLLLESCGFEKAGKMKYRSNDKTRDYLYLKYC